jgi:hypothetical protein
VHSLLKSFAEWLQNTPVPIFVSDYPWTYQIVQFTHFTGLSLWLGTNIGLDLHLLGVGPKRQTSAVQFLKMTIVWNWIGLFIAVLGGLTLFSTAAATFIDNPAFETKIFALLPIALIWHIVVQVKTYSWGHTNDVPKVAKVAGAVEIVLWFCVATAAVDIPYF